MDACRALLEVGSFLLITSGLRHKKAQLCRYAESTTHCVVSLPAVKRLFASAKSRLQVYPTRLERSRRCTSSKACSRL